MKPSLLRLRVSFPLSMILLFLLPALLYSQDTEIAKFPNRPISYIQPFTAGSPADIAIRLITREAEKILGTVHIAFGNNLDMPGGKNPSINHMDFLISKPTVKIIDEDNSTFDVLVDGTFKHL